MSDVEEPLFSFGVIADIQYADIDDAMNFSKTEQRWYRGAYKQAKAAVSYWKEMNPPPLFVAQLGDLIDGQNSGTYGQGLSLDAPQSKEAFQRVMDVLHTCTIPMVHAVGNHELYNFTWEELSSLFNCTDRGHTISKEEFYFSFSPYEGWTFVMLNSYAVSIMQPEECAGYKEASRLLERHNKNFLSQGKVNYFDGLEGLNKRFVPFNGGLGTEQLEWLRTVLSQAKEKGDKVVIFTHAPLYEGAASARNLAFDYDEALTIIHEEGEGSVVAVMAGHFHRGGYAQDEHGVHHVTIQSPLTHGACFGVVEVYPDHLALVGQGAQRSHMLSLGD
jgi:manganese-dependent ADP-ribose/CDP-alcohol diphosphatase